MEEYMEVQNTALKSKKDKYDDKDKIRAAYALNMCMVSISQIIDYQDLYILEQEYDGILNNLNLEMMPKDKALLKIIKQILDTITFFRIEEGDKKFIDREYQQKMKDAIWKAVPNFGLIVAGGNPVSMAISLASQVGIGYMNYRRAKSENALEYEKQLWQLQRSAIEQFNGLRRELFDTAWRLADKYGFPDDYRLTERQIDQYNEILMDPDEIRRYERLESIKEKFIAYPPFWYQFGSTANHIAWNREMDLSNEVRESYRAKALGHFRQFWKSNEYALLREDQVASSCALEQIDLLDVKQDTAEIRDLLHKAIKHSGDKNDILQLCAIAQLKIGDIDEASKLLRRLVNESYNTTINAQILSVIYVDKAISGDQESRNQYEILARRVDPDYLVRLPGIGMNEDKPALLDEFNEKQENILQEKYNAVIDYIYKDFTFKLTKKIPVVDVRRRYPDYYFRAEGVEQRRKDYEYLFRGKDNERRKEEYRDRIIESNLMYDYFDMLNSFFDRIMSLDCIRESQKIQEIIEDKIIDSSRDFNWIIERITDRRVDYDDICKLITFTSFGFFEDSYKEIKSQIETTIIGFNTMEKFASADSSLHTFCRKYGVPEPEELIKRWSDKSDDETVERVFKLEMLGKEGEKIQKEQDKYRVIEKIIKFNMDKLNSISKKAEAYLHDSDEFKEYFNRKALKRNKALIRNTIAVYNDKSFNNVDILFTVEGIIPLVHDKEKNLMTYLSLASNSKRDSVLQKFQKTIKSVDTRGVVQRAASDPLSIVFLSPGYAIGKAVIENKAIESIVNEMRPMFDEICEALVKVAE